METLTVDGVEVSVERGTTILEAAQKAGVRVPTLCHDKRLVPYGACRLCMVEVTARGRTRYYARRALIRRVTAWKL